MIFKFIEKKIVLDCFTCKEIFLKTSPIEHATKHLPDWWKKLPPSYNDKNEFFPSPTMKNCMGLINYYKNSLAIPLWSEMCIKVENTQYWWQFSDQKTEAVVHDLTKQATGFLHNHGHIKIVAPWVIKTKESIDWVWSQPTYNFHKDNINIKVLPGTVNFYKERAVNINLLVPLEHDKIYTLPHGQVMAHLTPMSNKKVEIKRHLVSYEEFENINSHSTSISFINKYKTVNDSVEKFLKCPYTNH